MRRPALFTVITALVMLAIACPAAAQTLNNILTRLQALENRLVELEKTSGTDAQKHIEKTVEIRLATIETGHKNELEKVRSKLEELSSLGVAPKIDSRIASLELHIDRLQKNIDELRAAADKPDEQGETIELLVADLGGLIGELRNTIGNPAVGETLI